MPVLIKTPNKISYDVIGQKPQHPKVDSIKIDKIAITLDIPNHKERKSIDDKLKKMNDNEYSTYAIKMTYKHGYRIFIHDFIIDGSPDRVMFLVHTNPTNPNHNYLRVEFNPSKVPSFFIKEYLNILLKDGYSRLINHGKVTVFHEAVDVHFCNLKDLYLYFPKFQCSSTMKKGGDIQSVYLGKTIGDKYFCIYNKTKEIQETNSNFYHDQYNASFVKEPVPSYDIMRIELRQNLKKMGVNISGLINLPNHFLDLKIIHHLNSQNSINIKTDNDKMIFKFFLIACNHLSLDQARLILTSDWRKKIAPIIDKSKAFWWIPEKITGREATIKQLLLPSTIPQKYLSHFIGLKSFLT